MLRNLRSGRPANRSQHGIQTAGYQLMHHIHRQTTLKTEEMVYDLSYSPRREKAKSHKMLMKYHLFTDMVLSARNSLMQHGQTYVIQFKLII